MAFASSAAPTRGINPHKPHDILPSDVGYFASQVGTNAEALASVTSLAAQACRLGHRKGRVAVGYDADLLAVAGDPVTAITAMVQARAVFRAGQCLRDCLSGIKWWMDRSGPGHRTRQFRRWRPYWSKSSAARASKSRRFGSVVLACASGRLSQRSVAVGLSGRARSGVSVASTKRRSACS